MAKSINGAYNLETQTSTAKLRSFIDLQYFWLYGISYSKLTRVRTVLLSGLEYVLLLFAPREGASHDSLCQFLNDKSHRKAPVRVVLQG